MTDMTIQRWLDDQLRLQATAYGEDPSKKHGKEWADSWMMNVAALMSEVGEMSNEVPWKPWSVTRGRPNERQRTLAVKELVDVMHFVANMFLLLGVSGQEFEWRWREKQLVNAARQLRGYDATAPGEKLNGRATDDPLDDPAAGFEDCLAESAAKALGEKGRGAE